MKLLLLALLAISAYGQTGSLCWTPDKTVPAKNICMDVPPAAKKAIKDFADGQAIPPVSPATDPTPKYGGIGDVLLSNAAALIDQIVDLFPPASIATDKAAAAASLASADAKKTAILDRTPKAEPK